MVVRVVLVTGMSGTGKSTVLAELARRGHRTVDTDYDGYAVETPEGQLWVEDRITALLDGHREGILFLAGTVANQRRFHPRFDAVALLTAPPDVLLTRLARRENNPFGKTRSERTRILTDLAEVEPLLRSSADVVLDTRAPLSSVADALEKVALGAAE